MAAMAAIPRVAIAYLVLAAVCWPVRAFAAGLPPCVGDCTGDRRIDVSELVLGVTIALGERASDSCRAFANVEGEVTIEQLVLATGYALNGCPATRFVDNADGTITDTATRLVWEKKVGLGAGMDLQNLHAADNQYLVAGGCGGGIDYCQPNEAARTACLKSDLDEKLCPFCAPILDLQLECDTGPYQTVWDWIAQLNATRFAGQSDWRIPTVDELSTLADYTAIDPALDRAFFGPKCGGGCMDIASSACSCNQTCGRSNGLPTYWSASKAVAGYENEPWYVDFCGGGIDNIGAAGTLFVERAVRAVRGRWLQPVPRFRDNQDGTISDRRSGLMWQKEQCGRFVWAGKCERVPEVICQPNVSAAATCAAAMGFGSLGCSMCGEGSCVLDSYDAGVITTVWDRLTQANEGMLGTHSDWRVPTIDELESIVDYSMAKPALFDAFGEGCNVRCSADDDGGSPCITMGAYWSSTNLMSHDELAWMTGRDGEVYNGDKYYVSGLRLVRNEQQ
ncbi:MAG: DUF1566 domain-containing protein [bacterium]